MLTDKCDVTFGHLIRHSSDYQLSALTSANVTHKWRSRKCISTTGCTQNNTRSELPQEALDSNTTQTAPESNIAHIALASNTNKGTSLEVTHHR
jgi:hypothetical protein